MRYSESRQDALTGRPLPRTAFGFVAAIMERLPIVGLLFSVSNRVGAAMWAHGASLPHLFSAHQRADGWF